MKNSIESKLLLFSFLAIYFGGGIYLITTVLIPFRIGLVVLVILFLYNLKSQKLAITFLQKILIILFSYQYIVNSIVVLCNGDIESSKFLNSFILYIYIMVVILLFFKNKVILSNSLFKSVNIFLLILVISTYIEWNYQIHFSFSRILEMDPIYNYIPTAYYTNQNDLMAIYTMMLLYSLVYMSYFNINNFFYKIYYIFISIYGVILSIVTSSRIGLVSIILLILIFLFKQKKIIVFFVLTILLIIFYIYSDIIMDYYYLNRLNSGNSTFIRINLYKDAIENITIFGYGFDNSDLFYTQLNDSNLLGIINPHNYLLELLINNGYLFFIFYFLLNIFLFIQSILYKKYILAFAFIMYYFILLSSSSSLFLLQHYIFYISFIVLLQIKKEKNE